MFHKSTEFGREEAIGLEALGRFVRVPQVLEVSDHHISLEKIETESPTPLFWQRLAEALRALHEPLRIDAESGINPQRFGFPIDNHIGPTLQKNPPLNIPWPDYFYEHRLKPMAARLSIEVPDVRYLLEDCEPSLLHGDFWSGNFLCAKGQEPVFIDPAPYFGHFEVDLAMSELFGGFAPEFYKAYPHAKGYERRRDIYNLYHLMNHWLIFGDSYREQTLRIMRSI